MTGRFRICSLLILTTLLSGMGSLAAAGSQSRTWKNSFGWQAGRHEMNAKSNSPVISELESLASAIGENRITKVRVSTYSSPEGKLSWNTKLSGMRSSAVASLLKEKISGLSDSLIVVEAVIKYVEASDKDWKAEALEILKSGKSDIETPLQDLWGGVVWDELMWNCFTRIRRTVVSVEFTPNIEISESSEKSSASAAELCFKFPVGKTSFDKAYMDNGSQAGQLSEFVAGLPEGATIVLDSFSSPEGRSSWNKMLAKRRAESVKQFLVDAGVPADRITVRTTEENWAGLADSVRDCFFGQEKQTVLDILADDSLDDDQKEQKIASLSNGSVWNRIVADMMQPLRYVAVAYMDNSAE